MRNEDKIYRPTARQWRNVCLLTEIMIEDVTPHSRIELIDFNKNSVNLKGGKRIYFDYLSEEQYLKVCENED